MFGKKLFCLVIVATAFVIGVPVSAQDKQSIEKNLPDDLYGEWCFAEPDNGTTGTNYKLPSWADTCDKDKILSIGRQWFDSGDGNCHPISKIKVKVECAPSGCATWATFRAECSRMIEGTNRTWSADIEISRYKGNLDIKGLQSPRLPVVAAPVPRPNVDLSLPAYLEKHKWALDNSFNCRNPGKTYGLTFVKNDDGVFIVFRDALGNVDKEQINTDAATSSVMFSTVTVQSLHRTENQPFGTNWTYVNVNDEMIRVLRNGQPYHFLVRCS